MLHHTPKDNPNLFKQETSRCAADLPENKVRFQKLRTMNPLHLCSAVMLIVLGLSVIVLSMIGLIVPLWVAAMMSMIGSAATMVGVYQLHETVRERTSVEKLSREAVQRIINEQN